MINADNQVRLSLAASVFTFIGFGLYTALEVWGRPVCYNFISVSVTERGSQQDQDLAERVRNEATTRTFCGRIQYSALLTIESLAQEGVVSQVSFQWLEPNGWSFRVLEFIDFLDDIEITASGIIDQIYGHVYWARLRHFALPALATILASGLILLLGFAIAWVRRGFTNG